MRFSKTVINRVIIALIFVIIYFFIKEKIDFSFDDGERKEIDFYICDESEIPDNLAEIMNNKKKKAYELTYENGKYVFIAIGYGEKSKDNQVVVLKDIYETDKVIGVETTLYTDSFVDENEEYAGRTSRFDKSFYPCIVIRCEKKDKPVYFKVSYIK